MASAKSAKRAIPKWDDLPELCTIQQVQSFLQISRNAAYEFVKTGKIASVRLGRLLRVPKSALLDRPPSNKRPRVEVTYASRAADAPEAYAAVEERLAQILARAVVKAIQEEERAAAATLDAASPGPPSDPIDGTTSPRTKSPRPRRPGR